MARQQKQKFPRQFDCGIDHDARARVRQVVTTQSCRGARSSGASMARHPTRRRTDFLCSRTMIVQLVVVKTSAI